jgi:tetratricopeptide (TPR) repeat protein
VSAADDSPAGYVGSERCAQCHEAEAKAWRGSHHDLAMTEASEETVLGDFNDAEITAHGVTSRFYRKEGGFYVRTDGPDGALHDYPIRYTFGWYPLQQYLIEFPRGHFQSLGLAWDSRSGEEGGQRWFHLYPDEELRPGDPLHWTSRDQTWNYQCAECHSTNLKKNYDLATDSYNTTWNEIDVACEACHGPGSNHAAWADAKAKGEEIPVAGHLGLMVDLADRDEAAWVIDETSGKPRRTRPRQSHTQIELCARCHSRRGQIWEEYTYGKPLHETHRPALLEEHLYFPDGQIKDEVYVYGSFIQSSMYRAGVTCKDCHEPHSQKRYAEGNALCARCHLQERYDTAAHHKHPQDSTGAACTACHMPQRTYMVNDDRADHSMRVPRPDLSLSLGTPNACNGCHADQTTQWAADAVEKWYPDSAYRGDHFGQALWAAQTGAGDAARRLLALAGDESQPGIARATAVERLGERPAPDHLFTVQRLLVDTDPLVRAAAVHYMAQTDLATRVDQVWPLLEDPARIVRLEVERVLAPVMRQRLPEKYRTQLQAALAEYARAQAVNADRPESHLNMGLMYLSQGLLREAEQAYLTALRLDPAFGPGYVNLSDLYRQTDRDKAGEALLRKGMSAVADSPDLHHALGLLLVRQKRMQESIEQLRRAAELAPERSRYAYVHALALQSVGEAEQAARVLRQALERDPANREIQVLWESMQKQ